MACTDLSAGQATGNEWERRTPEYGRPPLVRETRETYAVVLAQ